VEKAKPGRPKSDKPIRDKSITIKLTEHELKRLKDICYEDRIAYIDVLLDGMDKRSRK
jgi:hypothetical protein